MLSLFLPILVLFCTFWQHRLAPYLVIPRPGLCSAATLSRFHTISFAIKGTACSVILRGRSNSPKTISSLCVPYINPGVLKTQSYN